MDNILFFLTPKAMCAFIYDDFSVRQALEKMETAGYAALPILNKRGEYRGTLTEGDLLWALKNMKYLVVYSCVFSAANLFLVKLYNIGVINRSLKLNIVTACCYSRLSILTIDTSCERGAMRRNICSVPQYFSVVRLTALPTLLCSAMVLHSMR